VLKLQEGVRNSNCENQLNFASKIWFNFESGFSCHEAPGKYDASEMNFLAREPHIRPHKALAEVIGFKFRKSAEFHFKYLVQFEAGSGCHEAPGKSGGSKMHFHARRPHISPHEPLAEVSGFKLQKSPEF
jgi:hypothetical protein